MNNDHMPSLEKKFQSSSYGLGCNYLGYKIISESRTDINSHGKQCFGNWKSPSFPTNLQISEFINSQHNVKCLLGRLRLNIIIPDIPTGVQIYIHLPPKISPCIFSQRFRFYLAPSATSSPEDLRKVMKRSQSLSVPPFQSASLARFARFPSPNVIKGKAPKKHKTHKLEAGSQAAKRPLCSIRNPEMKCKLALRIGHALHMTHPQHDSWNSLSPPIGNQVTFGPHHPRTRSVFRARHCSIPATVVWCYNSLLSWGC